MAITASGLYGLTLEKMMISTALPTSGLESATAVKCQLVLDALTPNFDSNAFRSSNTSNEVSGTGYTAGGVILASPAVTLASTVLTYDTADPSWASSTITNAMAAVGYFARGGADTADELVWLSDFVTAASSSAGTFTVQVAAAGWWTLDYS